MDRDKIEMWAMTRFNARRIGAFTSMMVKPTPPISTAAGGGSTSKKHTPSKNKGEWAGIVSKKTPSPPMSRKEVESVATAKIKEMVPAIVRNVILNDNDNAMKTLKNNIRDASKNDIRIKFGKIYESFLIHELTKHTAIPRYKGFTGSVILSDRDSIVKWVTTRGDPNPGLMNVTSGKVIDFVNVYLFNFEKMINEYHDGTDTKKYNSSKLGPPNTRRLKSIKKVSKGFNNGTIPMTANDLWLQRIYVDILNPSILKNIKTLYIAGWFGLVMNLEVDLGGHAWIETDPHGHTIHHLHFGEIKSSPNINSSKWGVTQLIRLAFIAMKTMELLSEAHYIRVEATIFINDDEESFDFVSEFSPPTLTSHAKRVLSALNIRDEGGEKLLPMPPNAQFILSYQKIRGLERDTRGGDDYGTIIELFNNKLKK
jgi:hypothetical protein